MQFWSSCHRRRLHPIHFLRREIAGQHDLEQFHVFTVTELPVPGPGWLMQA
jgi:hypothetical protein